MPYRTTSCQLANPAPGDSRLISPRTGDTQCLETPLVRGTASQHIDHTASRRSGPRKWLRAIQWLINAGLHPKANQTTLRVAEDLAARMDYTTGHVRYCLDETIARLEISRTTVTNHVKYLRELGALAWAVHGSRTNRLRTLGLRGYAGTATIYAAVIPPVFDHAMGHHIIGAGYEARIVVDLRGQQKPVDNPPVDNSGSEALGTPSLTVVKKSGQVQVDGGFTTTATRQQKTPTAPKPSSRKRATILGNTVTAAGMQWGDKLARAIRRRVTWTRRASHDQLRWVCADMGEQQWTEDQAVRFATEAGFTHRAGFAWEPTQPHRLLAAELRAHQERTDADRQYQEDLARSVSWEESTAGKEAAARASLAALFAPAEKKPEYTAEDREYARLYGWSEWEEVAAHLAEDQDDAIALYGEAICKFAIGKQALLERQGAWA